MLLDSQGPEQCSLRELLQIFSDGALHDVRKEVGSVLRVFEERSRLVLNRQRESFFRDIRIDVESRSQCFADDRLAQARRLGQQVAHGDRCM